ncbi:hypothetical protein MPH_11562, partial [Macrophomina phaseolina MS6]
ILLRSFLFCKSII